MYTLAYGKPVCISNIYLLSGFGFLSIDPRFMGNSGRARSSGSHLYYKIDIFRASAITSWFYNKDDDKPRRKIKPVAIEHFRTSKRYLGFG